MPHRNPPDPGGPLRRVTSTAVVITFALVMTACVLGVMAWKALDAKKATLASGSADIQNLVHSLSEHASHTIQAVDIAMAGMVDLLKYRDPEPDRFNRYLAETAKTLPQLRGIGVADAKGNWRYSSLPETAAPQRLGPELFCLPSRYTGQHASDQRAVAVPSRRAILDDRSLEAHHQA